MSRKRQDEARATKRPEAAGAAVEAGLEDRDLDQVDGGFTPYAGFQGGVRVATGDVNGDADGEIYQVARRIVPSE